MEVASVTCASCGAPIKVPSDIESLNCAYCGAFLIVQRGEGYVSLKIAERVSQSIKETGEQTQSTIREGTQVTQAELKKLQLSQELSSAKLQLSNLQAEKRSLERQKRTSRISQQLKELSEQERRLNSRIQDLQIALSPVSTPQQANVSRSPVGKGKKIFGISLSGALPIFLCVCCLLFDIFSNTSDSVQATKTARVTTQAVKPESVETIVPTLFATLAETSIPTQIPTPTSITEIIRIEIGKELKSCCPKSSVQGVRLDGRELFITTLLDRTYLDDFFGAIGSIHGIIALINPDVDIVTIEDTSGQLIAVKMKDLLAFYNDEITWDEYRPRWVITNP